MRIVEILACILIAGTACADVETETALADVNNDGAINVLDVQGAVVQALQHAEPTPEADLDENGQVDVTDVQNLINSALGTGGVMQKVKGTLDIGAELLAQGVTVVAMAARDGAVITTMADTVTGEFLITLPIRKRWMLAVVTYGNSTVGLIEYPINDTVSTVLPLSDLSECDTLDLGPLSFGEEFPDASPCSLKTMRISDDLRNVIGSINNAAFVVDADGNGCPDTVDDMFAHWAVFVSPDDRDEWEEFLDLTRSCAANHLPELSTVSLVDADGDGTHDFIEPLIQCTSDNLRTWLTERGEGNIEMAIQFWLFNLVPSIYESLRAMQLPLLTDQDHNGIPDRWQKYLSYEPIRHEFDTNDNMIPDVCEQSR